MVYYFSLSHSEFRGLNSLIRILIFFLYLPDRIVTSSDLGLSLTCEYNLANKTVANLVDLKLTGEITPSLYEESVVDSPNVLMRVADDQGSLFRIPNFDL